MVGKERRVNFARNFFVKNLFEKKEKRKRTQSRQRLFTFNLSSQLIYVILSRRCYSRLSDITLESIDKRRARAANVLVREEK